MFISGQTLQLTVLIVGRKTHQQRQLADMCDGSHCLPTSAVLMELTTSMVVEGLTSFHGDDAGDVCGA